MDVFEKTINELLEVRTEYLEAWAAGGFTKESIDGTAQENAKAIGKVQMLDECIYLIKAAKAEYDNDET